MLEWTCISVYVQTHDRTGLLNQRKVYNCSIIIVNKNIDQKKNTEQYVTTTVNIKKKKIILGYVCTHTVCFLLKITRNISIQ